MPDRPSPFEIYASLLAQKTKPIVEPTKRPSWEEIYTSIAGTPPPKPSPYLRALQYVHEKTGLPMDIPSALIKETLLGYPSEIPTPPEASIARKVASDIARLAGIGLSTYALSAIPVVGPIVSRARLATIPRGLRAIPAMARAVGIPALKVGAVRGLIAKPEEPGLAGRLKEALSEAAGFGIFGTLGGGVAGLGKAIASKFPELATRIIGMGGVGAGAAALEPAETAQERLKRMLEGFLTFGGMEAIGGLRGRRVKPIPEPTDIFEEGMRVEEEAKAKPEMVKPEEAKPAEEVSKEGLQDLVKKYQEGLREKLGLPKGVKIGVEKYEPSPGEVKVRLAKMAEEGIPPLYQFEFPGLEKLPTRVTVPPTVKPEKAIPLPEQLSLLEKLTPVQEIRTMPVTPFYIPPAFTPPTTKPEVKPKVERKPAKEEKILEKIIKTEIPEELKPKPEIKPEIKKEIPKTKEETIKKLKEFRTKEKLTKEEKVLKQILQTKVAPKKIEVPTEPIKEEKIVAEEKPYKGLTPGTPDWMKVWKARPDLQKEMLKYAKKFEKPAEDLTEKDKEIASMLIDMRKKGKILGADLSTKTIKEVPILDKHPWELTFEEWEKYITDKIRKQEGRVRALESRIDKAQYEETPEGIVKLAKRVLANEEDKLKFLRAIGGVSARPIKTVPIEAQTRYALGEGETPPTMPVEAKIEEKELPIHKYQWADWVRQAIEQGREIPSRVMEDFRSLTKAVPVPERKPITTEKFVPLPARKPSKIPIAVQMELPGMKGLPEKPKEMPLKELIITPPEQRELFPEEIGVSKVKPVGVEKIAKPPVEEIARVEKEAKKTKEAITRERVKIEKTKRAEIFDEIEDLVLETEKDIEKYKEDYAKYVKLEEIAKNLPGHAEAVLKDLHPDTQKEIRNFLRDMGIDPNIDIPITKLAWNRKNLPPDLWVKKYRDKVNSLLQEWTETKKPKGFDVDAIIDKIENTVERDRASKDASIIDKIINTELKSEYTKGKFVEEIRPITRNIGKEWLYSHQLKENELEPFIRKIITGLTGEKRIHEIGFISSTNPNDYPPELRKFMHIIKKPGYKVVVNGGVFHTNSFKSLVILGYDSAVTPESMIRTAAHESWHIIEQWLLTNEEAKIVRDIVRDWKTENGNPSENAARLFEQWYVGRRINPKYTVAEAARVINPEAIAKEEVGMVQAIFNKIVSTLKNLKDYLVKTEKWLKVQDIFERAYNGEFARRPQEFVAMNYAERYGAGYPPLIQLDAEVRKIDETKSFHHTVTERLKEFSEKHFPTEPNPDLPWIRELIGLPYWTAERFPQFKPILHYAEKYFGIGDELMGTLFKTCESFFSKYNKKHPLYKRFTELIIKADAGKFKTKEGKQAFFPPPDVVRKYLNNDEDAIKAFYDLHKATNMAWMEKLRYTALDLLKDYEDKAWLPIYVEQYLFGRKGVKFEEIRDEVAEYLGEADAKEMEDAHNASFMKIKTQKWDPEKQQYVRDKKGNVVVDEQHIGDAIKEIREMLRSRFYFPHYRGDGRFYVRIVRKNLETNEEESVWRMHTDWAAWERIERKQYADVLHQAENRLNKYNQELKDKNLVGKFEYRLEKGRNEEYPDVIFPYIQKRAMAKFVEGTVEKLKTKGVIDKDEADLMSHTLIQTIKYDLMSRSASERRFIPREVIKNLENEDAFVEGYKIDDPHRAYISYFRVMANSIARNGFKIRAYDALKNIHPTQQSRLYSYSDKYIRKLLMSKTPVDRIMNQARSMAFLWYIGLNLRASAVQITQNITTGAPMLNRWLIDELGAKGRYLTLKAERALLKASKDLIRKTYKENDWERKALEELEERGATDAQYAIQLIHKVQENVGNLYSKIVMGSGFFFAAGERFNRQTLGLATYRLAREHYLSQGMTPSKAHDLAMQHAKTLIYRSHYLYGALNLPMSLMGTGLLPALGRTAYTFRSFLHNYVESILWSLRKSPDGHTHFDVLVRSLAALALLGGLSGLPFVDDLLDQAERIRGKPYRKEIEKALGSPDNPLQLGIMAGIPALVGVDLSGSFKIGLPKPSIPGLIDSMFGVWGGLGNKVENAWDAYRTKDFKRLVESLSPVAYENVLRARREYAFGATTPMGMPIYTETGEPLKLTLTEAMLKAFGFRPTRIAYEQRAMRVSQNVANFFRERKKEIYASIRKALTENDDEMMADAIERANKLNERIAKYGRAIPLIDADSVKAAVEPDIDKLRIFLGRRE